MPNKIAQSLILFKTADSLASAREFARLSDQELADMEQIVRDAFDDRNMV